MPAVPTKVGTTVWKSTELSLFPGVDTAFLACPSMESVVTVTLSTLSAATCCLNVV